MNENHDLPPELLCVGERVAALPGEAPRPGLAQRTLSRIARAAGSVQKESRWWLRNITHPAARIAAAVLLIALVGLFTNRSSAERIGRWVEQLIGATATDRIENLVDQVLPTPSNADPLISDAAPVERRTPNRHAPSKDQPASWIEGERSPQES